MLRPHDMKTPGRGNGAGAEGGVERGIDKANGTPQGPTIAQRRADSIRLQATGQQIGGAL